MRKLSNCKIILALTVIIFNSLLVGEIEARNFQYDGVDVIADRPEGELRFYKAEIEKAEIRFWDNQLQYYSDTYLVPLVFTPDGKVYVRNLSCDTPSLTDYTWMEGKETENGDLIFYSGELMQFQYFYAYFYEEGYPPLFNLKAGKLDLNRKSIEIFNSPEPIKFIRNNDGGYSLNMSKNYGFTPDKNRELVIKCDLTPSDIQPIYPPEGFKEEDYQISFVEHSEVNNGGFENITTLRLKVVRTMNEIYIKGLSHVPRGDRELWVKGQITGNKVIFRNGLGIGAGSDSKPMYFTPMNNEIYYDRDQGCKYYIPTQRDLMFDYDPVSGTLSNPSSSFGFTSEPNESWRIYYSLFHGSSGTNLLYDPNDFFYNAEIKKIPDDYIYKPIQPSFRKSSGYLYCVVNYLDENGYMMEPENLFLEVLSDNKPIELSFFDLRDWTQKTDDKYPFENGYIKREKLFDNWFSLCNYINLVIGVIPKYDIDRVNLLYLQDKNEDVASSQPIFKDNYVMDNRVYDLTGRICDPENLSPGIYIRNGKKFIVR